MGPFEMLADARKASGGVFETLSAKDWQNFLDAFAEAEPEEFYHGFGSNEAKAVAYWKDYHKKLPASAQKRIWDAFMKGTKR